MDLRKLNSSRIQEIVESCDDAKIIYKFLLKLNTNFMYECNTIGYNNMNIRALQVKVIEALYYSLTDKPLPNNRLLLLKDAIYSGIEVDIEYPKYTEILNVLTCTLSAILFSSNSGFWTEASVEAVEQFISSHNNSSYEKKYKNYLIQLILEKNNINVESYKLLYEK